jgi:hypothetical protein
MLNATVKQQCHSRPVAFAHFTTQRNYHGFYVGKFDIAGNGLGKYRFESSCVFAIHAGNYSQQ